MEWMELEVKAGGVLADGLVSDLQNPVHLGVRIGTAVGRMASKIFVTKGEAAAKAFLMTMTATLNQETVQVDPTQQLSVKENF
jgi:hypothetical protein